MIDVLKVSLHQPSALNHIDPSIVICAIDE